MNKNYIKPSITVVEMEVESLLNTFSQEGNGGVGITPGADGSGPVTGGDADAKGFWGSTWED